jgi:CelD/BcsL family acetyltransferase involved in cellulose biosynthesis
MHPSSVFTAEFSDEAAPAALESDWERLFARGTAEPSTSFEWTRALSHSHLKSPDRPLLLTLVRGGVLSAVVPLAIRRARRMGYPITALMPISEYYSTHSDLLADEVSAPMVDALLGAVSAHGWDVFRMNRLIDGSPLLNAFETGLQASGFLVDSRWAEPSYVLTLPGSFAEYLRSRSSKFRNHLSRTTRRLEQLGVRVVDLSVLPDFDTAYQMLLDVERRSWKHASGSAISVVSRQEQFYKQMGAGAAARGLLHLHFLVLDGVPVAHNYGYNAGGTYSYLKTSCDERVKSLGVATYLRARLVEELITRGISRLDFPAEPYEWERHWTSEMRWHKTLVVFNSTLVGRTLYALSRLRGSGTPSPGPVVHRNARSEPRESA